MTKSTKSIIELDKLLIWWFVLRKYSSTRVPAQTLNLIRGVFVGGTPIQNFEFDKNHDFNELMLRNYSSTICETLQTTITSPKHSKNDINAKTSFNQVVAPPIHCFEIVDFSTFYSTSSLYLSFLLKFFVFIRSTAYSAYKTLSIGKI